MRSSIHAERSEEVARRAVSADCSNLAFMVDDIAQRRHIVLGTVLAL